MALGQGTPPPTGPHLQGGPAGPTTVFMQGFLACSRAELQQLLPLQFMGGQAGQELEEGASRHAGDVQVLGHEEPHRAGLGQSLRVGDICSREQETVGSRGLRGGWGVRVAARTEAHLAPEAAA